MSDIQFITFNKYDVKVDDPHHTRCIVSGFSDEMTPFEVLSGIGVKVGHVSDETGLVCETIDVSRRGDEWLCDIYWREP